MSFQSSIVVYLCLHVLFVHLYAVIASVMVIVGIHARLIYRTLNVRCERDDKSARGADSINKLPINKLPINKHGEGMYEESMHASSTQSTHSVSGGQGAKDYSELVMKLEAGKNANGMG